MKNEHGELIRLISLYLEEHPELRFGQALHNLRINEFSNPSDPGSEGHLLRDIYQDGDESILERVREALDAYAGGL